ncbi:MAG: hypothetical protein EU532_00380 [Promethearchaeota archaeon]|nr:MAG: hypothetical protein EU532_00380 [Candidatus Lokiarchaeota archaeon]
MVSKKIKPSNLHSIGQVFTPNYVAEFMIQNSLKFFNNSGKAKNEIRILEPSAGKGVFLKYLIHHNFKDITAYEIDENLKDFLSKKYPTVNFRFENVLSSDINEKFDLIIGNPPYLGQNYNAELFQEYVSKYPICADYFVGNMDLFYFFIHIGILKLNPGGILSFITTNYWITKSKKTGIKLLKPHILRECFLLQYIDLSNLKLFKGATGQHNCIFILQKKNDQEKLNRVDMKIEIIEVQKKKEPEQSSVIYNELIFKDLIRGKNSRYLKRYFSALTNKDLEREGSWSLLYPKTIRRVVDQIEDFCSINEKVTYLKDHFIIRNGLILIKDEIFILNEGDNLKIENDDEFYLKVNNQFHKLSKKEIERLKKLYKSKSILPYGYEIDDYTGYVIYFNKKKFNNQKLEKRNQLLEKEYPNLTAYFKQNEKELRNILINAKENPNDLYFPRRGAFIRRIEELGREELIDLESWYDSEKKIFIKYISKENIFGYSEDSYYATSDTYFLWPKNSSQNIDYLFLLAYFNSKLVKFLFKAKNISIKRSKTKLEFGLPVPNLEKFHSKNDNSIVLLIKILSEYLIKFNQSKIPLKLDDYKQRIINLDFFLNAQNRELLLNILSAIKNFENNKIQTIIDSLFFTLFKLDDKNINYLLES